MARGDRDRFEAPRRADAGPGKAGVARRTAVEGRRVEAQTVAGPTVGRTAAGPGARRAADLGGRTAADSGERPGRAGDRRRSACRVARIDRAGTVRRIVPARRFPAGSADGRGSRRGGRRLTCRHRGAARRPDGSHPDVGSATRRALRVDSRLRPPAATAGHRHRPRASDRRPRLRDPDVRGRGAIDRIGARRAALLTGCRSRGEAACSSRPAGLPRADPRCASSGPTVERFHRAGEAS